MSEKEQINTPEFRVSFPQVFEPKAVKPGDKEKYSVVMLFDKSVDFEPLKALVEKAAKQKWGDDFPDNYYPPFTGNFEKPDAVDNYWIRFSKENANKVKGEIPIKTYDGYKDVVYGTASNQNYPPGVIEWTEAGGKQEIINPKDFYGGCYAIATVTAWAWDYMGKCGVSIGLNSVLKMDDGTPLKLGRSAVEDFASIPAPKPKPKAKPSVMDL